MPLAPKAHACDDPPGVSSGFYHTLFGHFYFGSENMFDRLVSLIGEDNFNRLKNMKIIVFGLGGVGGYTVESLVRSGVGSITVVDGDIVDLTNLNRQIIALNSTIGKKKTEVFKDRIADINSEINLSVIDKFLTPEDIESMDFSSYDYIVDCIDDVPVKEAIIRKSVEMGKAIISSMGTAKKLHPEMLKITTLDKTSYDPLARVLRKNLRDISKKVIVVTSDEQPCETENLGSNAFVPASAGLFITSYIVNDILEQE